MPTETLNEIPTPDVSPEAVPEASTAPATETRQPVLFGPGARLRLPNRRRQSPTKRGFRHPRQRPMRKLPPSTPAARLVRALESEISLGDELLALAALEELKRQNPQLRFRYSTDRSYVRDLLGSKTWFLDAVLAPEDPEVLAGAADAEYLYAPNPEVALRAEQELWLADYQQQVAAHEAELARRGQSAIQTHEAPEKNFTPTWHLAHAHLWTLAREFNVPVTIPDAPLPPYGSLAPGLRRHARRLLERAGLGHDLFVLYDFQRENAEACVAELQRAFPDTLVLSTEELATRVGAAAYPIPGDAFQFPCLFAALSQPNCVMAVGDLDPFAYLAWAAGQPAILALYDRQDAHWDGVFPQYPFLLAMDRVEPADVPERIRQAAQSLLAQRAEAS